MVLMKDDGELDTYTHKVDEKHGDTVDMKDYNELHNYSEELDDDGDAKVIMKDDNTYSPSDEGVDIARYAVDQGFGICNMVGTEDEKIVETQMSCLKLIQRCLLLW